jgi:hypothetical protein
MNNNQPNNRIDGQPDIKASCAEILQKIKSDDVKMRPRVYFTIKLIILAIISIITLITTVFLFSFVLFSVRASGEMLLLGFGYRGVVIFLSLFPWKTLFLEIVL